MFHLVVSLVVSLHSIVLGVVSLSELGSTIFNFACKGVAVIYIGYNAWRLSEIIRSGEPGLLAQKGKQMAISTVAMIVLFGLPDIINLLQNISHDIFSGGVSLS